MFLGTNVSVKFAITYIFTNPTVVQEVESLFRVTAIVDCDLKKTHTKIIFDNHQPYYSKISHYYNVTCSNNVIKLTIMLLINFSMNCPTTYLELRTRHYKQDSKLVEVENQHFFKIFLYI